MNKYLINFFLSLVFIGILAYIFNWPASASIAGILGAGFVGVFTGIEDIKKILDKQTDQP